MDDRPATDPLELERIRDRLRLVLGAATLLMLVLSWPLWIDLNLDGHQSRFPRVPFIPRFSAITGRASLVPYFVVLGCIAASTVGLAWKRTLTAGFAILLGLILADQHRFQPWAYQFLLLGLLLTSLPPARALTYARYTFISLYFYSGLSKLDVSFCDELGFLFLTTALKPLGVSPGDWPTVWRVAATLAMPLWEIGVALALLIPRWRRVGVVGAIVQHATLIGILGPWGLRHSVIVLVWNAAMLAEVMILFGSPWPDTVEASPSSSPTGAWLGVPARLVFWLAVILPLGERGGWFDTWPSHALYASHAERVEIAIHDEQSAELDPALLAHLGPPGPDLWRRLDLTGWSRATRGVPVYPQGRACNGLAESIAARYRGHLLIKVVQWGRADPWTGRRSRVECLGLNAIRRHGNRYWLNSHPTG